MIHKLKSNSWTHTGMAFLMSGSISAMSWFAPSAFAASDAVKLTGASYVTLSQAALSSSSLQFSIDLHNGGSQTMDFNEYGVRITDTAGRSFTANLSGKKSASVAAGQDQTFRFYSNLAAGETAEQLKVDIFRWDSSKSDFMNQLGTLSVASVIQEGQVAAPEEILNMHAIDSTLATDESVAFSLGQSVRVFENNKWYMYTQLSVKNLGSSSLTLPSALLARLVDTQGMKYAATLTDGADQAILPGESEKITLKAAVSEQLTASGLSLEFYYMNLSEVVSLGYMDMNSSLKTAALGDKFDYARQSEGEYLTLKTDKTTYSKQADGLHVQSVVTVSNEGDKFAALPSLLASYQFGGAQGSVSSTDSTSHHTYLSPKESVSYYFNAVLPADIDPGTAQLVVWEKTSSASTSSASSSTASTGTTSSATTVSSTTTTASNTASNSSTSQAPLAVIQLKGATEAKNGFTVAASYQLGDKMTFNNNSVMDKNLQVSLVELHAHVNDDLGYKTAIGKYKITNTGLSPIDVPELQNELIDSQGKSFTGSRQSTVAAQIMPGTSYVVSYSYILPETEKEDTFALNVYDDKSVSEGNVSLCTYQAAIQPDTDSDEISLYPFSMKVEDSSIGWTYSSGTYSYVLSLTLDIEHKDQVIIDSNFSNVEFDLVDSLGRVLGSQTMTLTGTAKLTSGKQKVTISGLKDEQVSSGVNINMYETIETHNGTAKRLVKVFK